MVNKNLINKLKYMSAIQYSLAFNWKLLYKLKCLNTVVHFFHKKRGMGI